VTRPGAAAVAIAVALTFAACSGGHHALVRAARTPTGGPTSTSTTETTAAPPTTLASSGTIDTSPPSATAPSPPTTTAGTGIVVVSDADDGKSFTLRRGQQMVVRLSATDVWTEPASSDARVLARTAASTKPDGSAEATFVGSADGQAAVTAEGRSHPQPCQTAQPPCMVPDHVREFHVDITVTG
jgi:hypothetical protein